MKTLQDKWAGWKSLISDGCTLSPDFNFTECCEKHDYFYKRPKKISRWKADKLLFRCIRGKFGWIMAGMYWVPVRCVGWMMWQKKEGVMKQ